MSRSLTRALASLLVCLSLAVIVGAPIFYDVVLTPNTPATFEVPLFLVAFFTTLVVSLTYWLD